MQATATTVKLGKVKYSFDIKSKFTIIRGDSGTGKTTLINMLRNRATVISSPFVFMPLVPLLPKHTWDGVFADAADETVVFYADEDFDCLHDIEFQKAMSRSALKFLLVTRNPLASVPYGVSDVYEIVSKGDEHRLALLYPDETGQHS